MSPRTAIAVMLVVARTAAADVPRVGVMTDLGVPDGATASVAVRPTRALRVELGVAHDGIGPGVRGGVTWVALPSWVTPVVSLGYGRFFERDANPLARVVTQDATFSSPLLDRVGYQFATARTGIELGRRHVTFFLHAGVTAVTGTLHDLAKASNDTAMQAGSQITVSTTDPHFQLIGVSADLGMIVYLR